MKPSTKKRRVGSREARIDDLRRCRRHIKALEISIAEGKRSKSGDLFRELSVRWAIKHLVVGAAEQLAKITAAANSGKK